MKLAIKNLCITIAHNDHPIHYRYFNNYANKNHKTAYEYATVDMCFHPDNEVVE